MDIFLTIPKKEPISNMVLVRQLPSNKLIISRTVLIYELLWKLKYWYSCVISSIHSMFTGESLFFSISSITLFS